VIRNPGMTARRTVIGILRSALFLATYCGLGIRSICLMQSSFGINGEKLSSVAGAIRGLCVLFEKKGRRIELALYVFSQALKAGYRTFMKMGWAPNVPHADVFILSFSIAVIMQAYTFKTDLVRPAYRSILKLVNVGKQIKKKESSNALSSMAKKESSNALSSMAH